MINSSILYSKTNQKILFVISILINLILTTIIFATINEKQIYTYFNSDTLYLPSIYKDLFIDKSGFEGWHLNGAPNFLPDMLLFFIVRSLFSHFIPACFAFSLIQIAVILILLSVLYKTIFKTINYIHLSFAVLLMTFFLLVTLVNNDFVYTFYLLSISYHLGAFIMLLISFIFLFKYISSGKNLHLLILFIVSILSIINDRLYLVMFSFPIYALLFFLFLKVEKKERFIKILIYNTASILIGLFLFRMLKLSGYIHIIGLSWKVFNFNNIIPALKIFLEQHTHYLKELDYRGIINILFLISFVIHLYLLIKNVIHALKGKTYNELEFIYLLIFIPTILIILVTPIINGNYVSWALLRYNIYSLYLGIFSFAYLFYKLWATKRSLVNYFVIFIVLFIVVESVFIVKKVKKNNIIEGLDNFITYYPDHVKCIDELSEKRNLKYGISEYWKAKYITMFSKEDVRIYTVLDNLSIWYHVMNENWYYQNKKGEFGNPEFSFIISNGIKNEAIIEHLGIPLDTIKCSGNLEILKYSQFQFDKKTRKPSMVN